MLIINGKVLTMADQEYTNGYVRIAGSKIDSVGDMPDLPDEFYTQADKGREEILDVKSAWVMPGLIDAHCHVGIAEEKWGAVTDDCNCFSFQ